MKTVKRNVDRPHRCPECYAVRTWSRPLRFYRWVYCSPCHVRWWPGWVLSRTPGASGRRVI